MNHYEDGAGATVTLQRIGLLEAFRNTDSVRNAEKRIEEGYKEYLLNVVLKPKCDGCTLWVSGDVSGGLFDETYDVTGDPCLFAVGNGQLFNRGSCQGKYNCMDGTYNGACNLTLYIRADVSPVFHRPILSLS